MNALHQALEAATAVYYKPRRIALLWLAHATSFVYILATTLITFTLMAVVLCIMFQSFWPLVYCMLPILIAFIYVSYEIGKELKMIRKVVELVKIETGTQLSIEEARPMVHMIKGYLFAEHVIQENL